MGNHCANVLDVISGSGGSTDDTHLHVFKDHWATQPLSASRPVTQVMKGFICVACDFSQITEVFWIPDCAVKSQQFTCLGTLHYMLKEWAAISLMTNLVIWIIPSETNPKRLIRLLRESLRVDTVELLKQTDTDTLTFLHNVFILFFPPQYRLMG